MFCSGDIENIVLRFVEEEENNNGAVRSKQNHERKGKKKRIDCRTRPSESNNHCK